MKKQPYAIEIAGLTKTFGDFTAVDCIDLKVPAGGIYGVLGPNGAGKTTTINMLATLMKPDAGMAKIFGHDVVHDSQIVRQLIGVTGQYASVDEKLSGVENLVIFGRLLGLSKVEAKKKAADLLEEFGLTEAAKRPLEKFSGGMRRRLDLAVSLIAQPPLIFLDEPTTGLDPRTRNQMWNTIRRLVKNGSTILLTTQYLEEADQLADRIAVIDKGKVVAEGTPNELKKKIGASRLQLHIKDKSHVEAAAQTIQSTLGVHSENPEAHVLTAPMSDPDKTTDLLLALRKRGIHLDEISVQKPTLDEVFFALTGKAKQPKTKGAAV